MSSELGACQIEDRVQAIIELNPPEHVLKELNRDFQKFMAEQKKLSGKD